jgi:lysophospholipase L1-like esterase
MDRDRCLLALGDCNTLGTIELEPVAYPQVLGGKLGVPTINCGHTMSTVREGWEYARRKLSGDTAYLVIQFGQVDAWHTFRGAPYVLNYPDNIVRRVLRKLVKKFKKLARKAGVHRWLGERNVVGPVEYQSRLKAMIQLARQRSPQVRICLVATPPSLMVDRNPRIEAYNRIVKQVAEDSGCAFVDAYSVFLGKPEMFVDPIHLNGEAHALVAQLCWEALRSGGGPRSA